MGQLTVTGQLLRSVHATWLASGTSLALGLAGFLAFQGWYDTGRVDTDLSFYFYVIPFGLIAAAAIIAGENAVATHLRPSFRGFLATTLRCVGYGATAIAIGYLVLVLGVALVYRTPQPVMVVAGISAVMTLFYLPMMLPFGLVSGGMMGIVLWLRYRFNR